MVTGHHRHSNPRPATRRQRARRLRPRRILEREEPDELEILLHTRRPRHNVADVPDATSNGDHTETSTSELFEREPGALNINELGRRRTHGAEREHRVGRPFHGHVILHDDRHHPSPRIERESGNNIRSRCFSLGNSTDPACEAVDRRLHRVTLGMPDAIDLGDTTC